MQEICNGSKINWNLLYQKKEISTNKKKIYFCQKKCFSIRIVSWETIKKFIFLFNLRSRRRSIGRTCSWRWGTWIAFMTFGFWFLLVDNLIARKRWIARFGRTARCAGFFDNSINLFRFSIEILERKKNI